VCSGYGGVQTRDGPDAGVDAGTDLETQGCHMENSLHDMYFILQLRRQTSVLSDK